MWQVRLPPHLQDDCFFQARSLASKASWFWQNHNTFVFLQQRSCALLLSSLQEADSECVSHWPGSSGPSADSTCLNRAGSGGWAWTRMNTHTNTHKRTHFDLLLCCFCASEQLEWAGDHFRNTESRLSRHPAEHRLCLWLLVLRRAVSRGEVSSVGGAKHPSSQSMEDGWESGTKQCCQDHHHLTLTWAHKASCVTEGQFCSITSLFCSLFFKIASLTHTFCL